MNAIMRNTASVRDQLTASGAPFELDRIQTENGEYRVYRHAPASLVEVMHQSRTSSDDCFMVYQDIRWSYNDFNAQVDALASWMHGRGIGPGSRVAIAMRNRPEWAAAFVAVARLGAVPALLNSFGQTGELQAALDDIKASLLVCDADRLARIGRDYLGGSIPSVVVGADPADVTDTAHAYEQVAATPVQALPKVTPAPEDTALILFTSGATSRAKAVVSNHRAVCQALFNIDYISAFTAMTSPAAIERIQALGRAPVILTAVPLFHVSGLHAQLLTALRTGRRLVFMHKWEPKTAIALMQREQVTQFNGAPSMVMQLLREAEFHTDSVKGGLAGLGLGGSGLPQGLIDEVLESVSEQLVGNGYGMTETNGVGAAVSGDLFRLYPDATGLISPLTEVRIMTPAGEEAAMGENGEICLRSITLMDGYLGNDDANRAALQGGWLRTGDLGHVSAGGFLYVVDRLKDVINRAGENIAAAEVESCLLQHPLVQEAAVMGVPDEETGEAVVAAVAIVPGEALEEAELQRFVAAHLASYKVPSMIAIQQETLPRNPAGKLLKQQIRQRLLA